MSSAMTPLQRQMCSLALEFGTLQFGVSDIHHNVDGHLPTYEQRTRSELLALMQEAVHAGYAVVIEGLTVSYEAWALTEAGLALSKTRQAMTDPGRRQIAW